eukprot:TRINITY_DN1549_c1_g2_i3.p1 TRINITY_DN1549_c1_g2~~TRINITY_DN1549_c1_g2_i3.p1  ORF type:complete len:499 (-),score=135.98 TRINITY_DN1549_c1_g2_i3:135-1631(-)
MACCGLLIARVTLAHVLLALLLVPLFASASSSAVARSSSSSSSFSSSSSSSSSSFAPSNGFNIRHHLGTKSPYWSPPPAPDDSDPSALTLLQVNFLARHGSREPTAGDIRSLDALAEVCAEHAASITNPAFAWLKNWTNPVPERNAGLLVDAGEMEHFKLAQRNRLRHHPLLSLPYRPYTFEFQSTQVSRTGRSASSFAYGLLKDTGSLPGGYNPPFVFTESMNQDIEFFFFKQKTAYEILKNSPSSTAEYNSWKEVVYKRVAYRVARLIGSDRDWIPTADQVHLMWTACGFEVSIADDASHFCELFEPENALLMEYGDDLKVYWQKSYGHTLNYAIACPLYDSVLGGMRSAVLATNTSRENATVPLLGQFRFAHAETLIPFVSLLGLFKDPYPLFANSTLEQITQRQWRTSMISPFAGNIAFFLYRGPQGYRVKLELNERAYIIPGCDEMYCPFARFEEIFASLVECHFCDMCFPDGTKRPECICNNDAGMKNGRPL